MVNKDIRRVVCGSCVVVAPPGEGSSAAATPSKVTLSARRRRGCFGWLAGPWRELAAFSFSDRARATCFKTAFLDLEPVFRYTRKGGAGSAEVKICVMPRSGATHVTCLSLEDFMGQNLQTGRLQSFVLYVHEGKVEFEQTYTPLPEVPTESNAPTNDSARKAEELFPAEEKDTDVAETEKETQEETVEDMTVSDEEKEALSDEKESGRGSEESDESDCESLEVTEDTGEESDLITDEGTDGEAEWESDDEDSEDSDSEREPDYDTGETDVETEETGWEADDEDSEEETERDSDRRGGERSEDEAVEDTAGEGPGSERGRVRLFLVVAAEVALILGTLKVWGPPAYMANWW